MGCRWQPMLFILSAKQNNINEQKDEIPGMRTPKNRSLQNVN